MIEYNNKYKNNYSHIVNNSSIAGFGALPYQTVYQSCKLAISSFSLALREEWKKYNINVSYQLVGVVNSENDEGIGQACREEVASNTRYYSYYGTSTTDGEANSLERILKYNLPYDEANNISIMFFSHILRFMFPVDIIFNKLNTYFVNYLAAKSQLLATDISPKKRDKLHKLWVKKFKYKSQSKIRYITLFIIFIYFIQY